MAIPLNAPYGYDMVEIPSNPSVSSSTNFGGANVKFTIEQPENVCYNGKQSYGSLQGQIIMTREDGSYHPLEPIINTGTRLKPTVISVPHLCPNPSAAIFDNIKCNLKGTDLKYSIWRINKHDV